MVSQGVWNVEAVICKILGSFYRQRVLVVLYKIQVVIIMKQIVVAKETWLG
jgi:hypothetical protein